MELDNPQEEVIPSFDSDFDSGEESYALGYVVPLNDHSFATLAKAMRVTFSDETERGRRLLIFNLKISGTPFSGYALIDPDFYHVKA